MKYPKMIYVENGHQSSDGEGYSEYLEDFEDGVIVGVYELVGEGKISREVRITSIKKKK